MARNSILIADDSPFILKLLSQMVTKIGYTPIPAEDGLEAIEIYKNNLSSIICVILDYHMPFLNGDEAIKLIKEINPNIPVILSTGTTSEDEMKDFIIMGFQAVLVKPYIMEDLDHTLKALLGDQDYLDLN